MERLKGKGAVITGAGSGIGRSAAELMSRQGARVVVADHDTEGAEETARTVEAAGGRALPVTVDVTDEGSIADMVAAAVAALVGDVLQTSYGAPGRRATLPG